MKETSGFQDIMRMATEIAGSPERALAWLQAPLPAFDGRSPNELLQAGREDTVRSYLASIESGFVG